MRSPRAAHPAVGFIFITLMLDVLGFGLIIPVAPKLVQSLQGGTEAQAAPTVALLSSLYYLMAFFCAPILGSLSDHFGRRRVILIALLGSGLDFLAMALAPNVWWLFITRAINGISGASMTAAAAYVADVTPPAKRAAAFGMMGAAFGLGFTVGPLMGGVLGSIDIRLPFMAAGVLTLINWLYGWFVLPESLAPENRRAFAWKRTHPVGVFRDLRRYPLVLGLAAMLFLINIAQMGLRTIWVLYTSHRYHWSPKDVGLSLFAVGVGAVVVQAVLARRIIPLLGERRSVIVGVGLGILSLIGYGMATQGWMIYVIIVVGSLAGISGPATQALITKTVRADEQGETQGALTGLESIAGIVGPIIGGTLFAYFISERAPAYIPGAAFYAGAALTAGAWLAAAWTFGRAPRPAGSPGPAV